MQHLYVISHPAGAVKIGIAGDPRRRLSALQIASPVKLKTEFSAPCDEQTAKKIEARAHSILSGHRQSGEWFSVTAAEAIDAVRRAIVEVPPCEGPRTPPDEPDDWRAISPDQCCWFRRKLGWSQKTLAVESTVSVNTIARFERGAIINKGNRLVLGTTLKEALKASA